MGTEYMIVDPYRRRYFRLGKCWALADRLREEVRLTAHSGSATRAERMLLTTRVYTDGGGDEDGEMSPELEAFIDKAAEFCQEACWLVHIIADGGDLYWSVTRNEGDKIYGWAPGPPFTDCTPED